MRTRRWGIVGFVLIVGGVWLILALRSSPDRVAPGGLRAELPALPRRPQPGLGASARKVPPAATPGAPAPAPAPVVSPGNIVETLVGSGWPGPAARAFVGSNAELIAEMDGRGDGTLARAAEQLRRLGGIRNNTAAFRAIESEPALAALLAWSGDPDAVLAAFLAGEDLRRVFLNVMLLQDDPDRVSRVAGAWGRHGRAVADCWEVGLVGAEAVFMDRERDAAGEEYDAWLADLLGTSAFDTPEALTARLVLAIEQGPEIRRLLRSEPDFQRDFRRILWPRLCEVTARADRPLARFLGHPRIWQLLAREDGVSLASIYGALPAEMLFGDDGYPAELRERVASLLRSRSKTVVYTLLNPALRGDGRFCDLLRRPLPEPVLWRIFDDLDRARGQEGQELARILNSDYAALEGRYAPVIDIESWDDNLPAYLKVPRRWLAGQPLDAHDKSAVLVDATADLIKLGVSIAGAPFGLDPSTVYEVVGKGQEAANGVLSEGTRRRMAEQKAQASRVIQGTSKDDERKLIEMGLPDVASSLALIQRHATDNGVSKGDCARKTVRYFYLNSTVARNAASALEREDAVLRFAREGRLLVVPRARQAEAFGGLGREEWSRQAARRWLSRAASPR